MSRESSKGRRRPTPTVIGLPDPHLNPGAAPLPVTIFSEAKGPGRDEEAWMSWSKDEVFAFLSEEPRLGRLATVTPAGEPHVVPIWFGVVGDELRIHTQAESTKAANIAATGRFAMAVDVAEMPYKGVSLRGTAEAVGEDVIDPYALARELAVAYLGEEAGAPFGDAIANAPGVHVTLVLRPREWEAWDYSRG